MYSLWLYVIYVYTYIYYVLSYRQSYVENLLSIYSDASTFSVFALRSLSSILRLDCFFHIFALCPVFIVLFYVLFDIPM